MKKSRSAEFSIGDREYISAIQMIHLLDGYDPEETFSFAVHSLATSPGFWSEEILPGHVSHAKVSLNSGSERLHFISNPDFELQRGGQERPCDVVVRDVIFTRGTCRMQEVMIRADFQASLLDAIIETLRILSIIHTPTGKWMFISFSGKQAVFSDTLKSGVIRMKLHKEIKNLSFHKIFIDEMEIGTFGTCVTHPGDAQI